MKKDPEEIIDQLLQTLRDVEAPAGMELRILHALEDRSRAVSPSKRRRNGASRGAARRWYWSIASGVAAATILLLAFVLHRPPRNPVTVTVTAQSQIPPAPSPTQPHAPSTLVATVSESTPPPLAKQPTPRHRSSLSAEERLCLRELRTPSHPAPPEPLTAEEKILLRIARTAAPEEIAMLNPELRAQQQASSAAEFERFVHSSADENQENQ
jgi:hypothetical protein